MKRPTSLTVFGVLAIIAGAIEALFALPYFGLSSLFSAFSVAALGGTLATYSWAMGLTLLVLGVVAIAFGVGALLQKSWAWMLGIVTFIVTALVGIAYMGMLGMVGVTVGSVLGVVLSIAIVVYLFTEGGREALGHGHHIDTHSTHMTPA